MRELLRSLAAPGPRRAGLQPPHERTGGHRRAPGRGRPRQGDRRHHRRQTCIAAASGDLGDACARQRDPRRSTALTARRSHRRRGRSRRTLTVSGLAAEQSRDAWLRPGRPVLGGLRAPREPGGGIPGADHATRSSSVPPRRPAAARRRPPFLAMRRPYDDHRDRQAIRIQTARRVCRDSATCCEPSGQRLRTVRGWAMIGVVIAALVIVAIAPARSQLVRRDPHPRRLLRRRCALLVVSRAGRRGRDRQTSTPCTSRWPETAVSRSA